jgi:hypothetical protein
VRRGASRSRAIGLALALVASAALGCRGEPPAQPGEPAAQPGEPGAHATIVTWSRVAAVDAHAADGGGFATGASTYRFDERAVPVSALAADARERALLFGERLAFRFDALEPGASYEARASFLSDCDARVEALSANGAALEPRLALPNGVVVRRAWRVEPDADGRLVLSLERVAGPNAVVSALEIWSSDPRPLRAPPSLEERSSAVEFPAPRLTPRPLAVAGIAKPRLSLDGAWRFAPVAPESLGSLGALGAADVSRWPSIEVPGEWALQGFTVEPGRAAAYWREFDVPEDWRGALARLRFDTVHSACRVWLNGVELGANESCFTPFELDATPALRTGRNVLALAVTAESISDVLASATQYAAHSLGGITRDVELFALPAAHVVERVVDADFDADRSVGILRAALELSAPADVAVTVLDGAANGASELEERALGSLAIGAGDVRLAPTIALAGIEGWNPEQPRLYRVRIEVSRAGRVVETLEQRVGFRRVEVRGPRLFVNGRPVKLEGACRHETHPLRGRSPEPALARRDVELFRRANLNYVRTSHYPPSEAFLDACDELGLFVECEAALCWVQHGANDAWRTWDALDPAYFDRMLRANLANLAANREHPSVILWSLANESRWSPLFAEVNRRVKLADPTRPTSFHDQCWGDYNAAGSRADVAVYHYPDETGPEACARETRPVLFGEYAHVECYDRRELAADPGVRDDWGRGLARMVDLMWQHDACLGGAIWAGIDDVFALPDGRFVGYGAWGAIADGWRREKPETHHVRKSYSPVRFGAPRVDGARVVCDVQNRFDFTNLRDVPLEWTLGARSGRVVLDVEPHARGELALELGGGAAGTLELSARDPRGFECERERFELGPRRGAPSDEGVARAAAPADARWTVDARGQVVGEVAGERVVVGGPELMLLPLATEACQPVDLGRWTPLNELASPALATATFTLEPDGARLNVRYRCVAHQAVDPRQWGAVIFLARACDRLAWRRDAQWTLYPADHIGRPEGEARANAASDLPPYAASEPDHPWSADATALGGNDFASTKAFVREASLVDARGRGVRVRSDGRHSVRAFVDGERIGFLIAGFHTGGGDGFFAPHFAAERRPLAVGDEREDEFVLELVGR